jgi:hypothetical protein
LGRFGVAAGSGGSLFRLIWFGLDALGWGALLGLTRWKETALGATEADFLGELVDVAELDDDEDKLDDDPVDNAELEKCWLESGIAAMNVPLHVLDEGGSIVV